MDSKKSRFKQNENVVRRDIADEILLVPIRGSVADMRQIFTLDEVSGFIWDQLERDRGYDEILAALLERYDVESERADADLEELVDALMEAELIVEVGS